MAVTPITALYGTTPLEPKTTSRITTDQGFDSIFTNAVNLVKDTNALGKAAEQEEIRFALGETENMHDLLVAQQKALISLQYTVAVKDKVIEAYNNIMNMQI